MTVIVYPDASALATMTVARLCLALADATAVREDVHLAIAGGSVGNSVLTGVADSPLSEHVDWGRVHVWWVDERFVPLGHDDRNDAPLNDVFDRLGLPEDNIHRMPSPDDAPSVGEGARMYAEELKTFATEDSPMPLFDVVLLGMGPDGHIASLFPGHEGLDVDSGGRPHQVTFAIQDSPKPPAERISLSLPAVNHTRAMWVAAWGGEKAPAIARGVRRQDVVTTPAAGVSGESETLWLTDLEGSSEL